MRVPLAVRALPFVAERVWWTPPRNRSSSLESVFVDYDGFQPVSIEYDTKRLSGFKVGQGPVVVLMHGWGGQAAQMAPLAAAISQQGLAAVAIDLPGHGSDGQKTSDAFQMAAAMRALIDEVGEPEAVVAHSLGAIAAQIAFDAGWPERTVLISPLLDAGYALSFFSDRAQLFPWTSRALRDRFIEFVGEDWWPRMTRGSDIELGKNEMLIVHDREDRETPFDTAAALAAKREATELRVTTGLGHSRLLADDDVVTSVAHFLAGLPSESAVPLGSQG